MIINHNMASLNTYRQLSANNANSAKSLEKLSSGLRINRAGDDAAGLAISEKMRGQIRGLDQAARNAQDGISMIQTAEGNLSETHSILQRMKELATQAANDTNVDADRNEIQKEINQLTSEINRIGNTTEFNTQKLLNGGGSKATEGTVITTATGGKAGNISTVQTLAASATGKATSTLSFTNNASDNLTITVQAKGLGEDLNGYSFEFVHDASAGNEGVSRNPATNKITITTNLATKTAADLTALVNSSGLVSKEVTISVADNSGATFTGALNGAVELTGKSTNGMTGGSSSSTRGSYAIDLTEAFVTVGDKFAIRVANDGVPGGYVNVELTASVDGAGTGEFAIGADNNRYSVEDQAKAIATALNAHASTKDLYDVSANGGKIVLTEKADKVSGTDIEKISVSSTAVQGKMTYQHSAQKMIDAGGKFTIDGVDIRVVDNSNHDFDAEISSGTAMEAGADFEEQITNLKEAINKNNQLNQKYGATGVNPGELTLTQNPGRETHDSATITMWDKAGNGFEAKFQIGANTAQSMTIQINDMRAQALKVSGTTAGGSITASNGSVATLKATKEVTDGTNNTSVEYALDVSSHDKATAAISVLDDAIQNVSAERSKLGAYQNRLEHTINNLGTSSENLTAAESRIRDVDMAKEMMNFQKNNILSQAAQAMLAQANQAPQGVLQLLR